MSDVALYLCPGCPCIHAWDVEFCHWCDQKAWAHGKQEVADGPKA